MQLKLENVVDVFRIFPSRVRWLEKDLFRLHIAHWSVPLCVCVCVYTMLKNTCTRIVNGKHLILKDVNSKSSNPLIQNVNCWNGSQSTHRNCKNDDGTFLFPIWMEIYYILFSRMERI